MAQKDVGNKVPIHKLKTTDEVKEFYDDWGDKGKYNEDMLDWKRNKRPAAQVYGGLCSAPFHFKHFDEVLADIGAAKKTRPNPLAEQFSYPNAEAFGQFLASAPQYVAD